MNATLYPSFLLASPASAPARRAHAAWLAAVCLLCVPLHACAAQPAGAAQSAYTAAPPYTAHDDAVRALFASSLPDPAGQPQPLAQYRGKITVVNFWASWCAPCVKEMPALSGLQRRYADKGVRFVGIGVDSARNISQFLSKVTIGYPVYVAGFSGAHLARQFGNQAGGLPFTVVIDKAGHVRYLKLGEIDAARLSMELDAL
ncbi:TlpA family protein disulfide reductase [Mycetohabitans sp. B5]|uniref:Thiol-disulfide isomerase/thioredoxin n=1 Tax=Mycetohabitans endofungorum TaxID=417203 RepID=A0A2P5K9K1_9BURK|nr:MULTISPECIES: TlpA disulfide reductase family protein [Mycetohabitans]MCG1053674.1 TlpA family protein disulfide reductase [Mycetohabitans sp. B5]PPB83398.1 thiol-disulfide isomerase/thioredoxin [Mycetohabitans endofungorum]